jgi:hypothetical protein
MSSFLKETAALERKIRRRRCPKCGEHLIVILNGKGLTGQCPNCDIKPAHIIDLPPIPTIKQTDKGFTEIYAEPLDMRSGERIETVLEYKDGQWKITYFSVIRDPNSDKVDP